MSAACTIDPLPYLEDRFLFAPLAAGQSVGLFYELVALPFAVGTNRLAVLRRGRFRLAGFSLPGHQIVMRGEILQRMSFEVVQRFEVVLIHERRQLFAHIVNAT